MWKFIIDVVHDCVSSLQPDVGRGFLHVSNVFLLWIETLPVSLPVFTSTVEAYISFNSQYIYIRNHKDEWDLYEAHVFNDYIRFYFHSGCASILLPWILFNITCNYFNFCSFLIDIILLFSVRLYIDTEQRWFPPCGWSQLWTHRWVWTFGRPHSFYTWPHGQGHPVC